MSNRISHRTPRAFPSLVTIALLLSTWLTLAPSVTGIESATSGGGAYTPHTAGPHASEAQRQRVRAAVEHNIQRLRLDQTTLSPTRVTLTWPLRATDGLDVYDYHGVSGFVDHNPNFPNQLLDYNCGERTYDTSDGYNHDGADFFTWPFAWNWMDQDAVQVVAAADGVIVYKEDGHYDRNCSSPQGEANAIVVLHGDGSVAEYWHLKNGSLTAKGDFDTVAQGEYLGVVGSSGYSTGPHLHFAIYDWRDLLVDPFYGPCNTSESWWDEQRPYYDSAVNLITTGSAPPDLPNCDPETSYEQTVFMPGDTLYFTTYYHDQLSTLPSQYTIYEPDGSVYDSWSHSMPPEDEHYAASWWWWSFDFDYSVPTGTWRFEVVFNGQTYTQHFFIGELPEHLYLPLVQK